MLAPRAPHGARRTASPSLEPDGRLQPFLAAYQTKGVRVSVVAYDTSVIAGWDAVAAKAMAHVVALVLASRAPLTPSIIEPTCERTRTKLTRADRRPTYAGRPLTSGSTPGTGLRCSPSTVSTAREFGRKTRPPRQPWRTARGAGVVPASTACFGRAALHPVAAW
jgi:hypothetical protein